MDCCLYLTLSMGISPFFSKKTTLSFSIFSSDHFNCERPYYCISNTTKHLYRKTETEKERRLILFILSIIHFVYCYLPSPIQTLLSALVSHQIHRFINLNLTKRVTGLEFYVHSSPPVGNFTRPRRRSHIVCNHNYLINCIVHLFLLIIKYFLSSTIFALRVKGK